MNKKKEIMKKESNKSFGFSYVDIEFMSVFSHELRTSLAILKQLVMLLYEGTLGPLSDQQMEALVRMRHNVDRIKDSIDKLLDIASIEQKEFELRYRLVNLNQLLLDAKDNFTQRADEKKIIISYTLPSNDVNIFIDAERIHQVIYNLIDNAIKFTELNGRICVEVVVLETKIRVGVIDSGLGIAEVDLPKVFEKFIQITRRKNLEHKGVGLGLAIAKELVERHSGEIWVESQAGMGSKFYFTLPRFYTANLLTDQIKKDINKLLSQKKQVHLINLLIVNYKQFKNRITDSPRKITINFKTIISTAFRDFFKKGSKKKHIFIIDAVEGRYSLLFEGVERERIDEFCSLLSERIKSYFVAKKIENVFIALGVVSYPKGKLAGDSVSPSNLQIKEIYIGAEMRRYKRIAYKTDIQVVGSNNVKELSLTDDLSEGGLCFISFNVWKINNEVQVKFNLLKKKEIIEAKGRIAWVAHMASCDEGASSRYRVGLEFAGLSDEKKQFLEKELKLYYE